MKNLEIKKISQMSIGQLVKLADWLEDMGEACSPPFDGSYSYDTFDEKYHIGIKLMLCTCMMIAEEMGFFIDKKMKLFIPVCDKDESDVDICLDPAYEYYEDIGKTLLHFLIDCSEQAGFSFCYLPVRSEQGDMEACLKGLNARENFFKDFLSGVVAAAEDSHYYTCGMIHLWNDSLGFLLELLQSGKMDSAALKSIQKEKNLLYTLLDNVSYIVYAQPEITCGVNRYGDDKAEVTYSIGNILFEDMSVGGTYQEGSIMPTRIVELLIVGELVKRIHQKLFGKECLYGEAILDRKCRDIA